MTTHGALGRSSIALFISMACLGCERASGAHEAPGVVAATAADARSTGVLSVGAPATPPRELEAAGGAPAGTGAAEASAARLGSRAALRVGVRVAGIGRGVRRAMAKRGVAPEVVIEDPASKGASGL